jgi:pyruvate/2-oxoglutarate dehydrogenase complex dihydrolipoamide acyltransferase (E2) component
MTRVGVSLALLGTALVAACGSKAAAPNPPGLRDGNGQPIVSAPAAQPAAPAPPPAAPAPVAVDPFPAPAPEPAAAPAEDPIAELIGGLAVSDAGADNGARPRDLAAEVSAQLDPRGACLDLARIAQGDGRITLSASVTLLPSGRISRATVSAPGQPNEARTCLEQRLLSAQLGGNVPGAPRTVSASFTLEVSGAQPTPRAYPGPARATTPDLRRRPDVAQPDQTDLARPDPGDVAGAP